MVTSGHTETQQGSIKSYKQSWETNNWKDFFQNFQSRQKYSLTMSFRCFKTNLQFDQGPFDGYRYNTQKM